MNLKIRPASFFFSLISLLAAVSGLQAQGTLADYQRAQGLQAKARGLVVNAPGPVTWIAETDRFWYPRSVKAEPNSFWWTRFRA
jgi:hypothetical protein